MGETKFWGYSRLNGSVGIRNHVAIISATDSCNEIVRTLARSLRGAIGLPVWYGRGQYGEDKDIMFRTIVGLGSNPNVHSVLIVSLEPTSAFELTRAIAQRTGKLVESINVQDCGDSVCAISEGMRAAVPMIDRASEQLREPFSVDKIVVGMECGGSDTTSGLASNPALGEIADQVVDAGGSVVFGETSEIVGAEHILARRGANSRVSEKILDKAYSLEAAANQRHNSFLEANPTPDNVSGGLTTIEEKSLGAIAKAGSREIEGVLSYAEPISGRGLYFMDTPAPASESMTGFSAGGAQVILFSTGKGNILGSPISPTIKVTGNPQTAKKMNINVDVEVTEAFEGKKSIEEASKPLMDHLLSIASGKRTRSEILFQEEIAIKRIQPSA